MPIVRRKLDANTVYPTNIQYNPDTDTVQSNVNGDWVDNPAADPRHQTTLPPRLTANPNCDAAQSVVDALHGQIDGVLAAIDNSATLFTIAGIILSIFTFGTFAIFISLALGIGDQMLTAGTAAITAALTEAVYDTLKCILDCEMDGSGHIDSADLASIISQVNAQIGGLGATIINSMLALAGEGGINNLASLGMSSGDCTECGCELDLQVVDLPGQIASATIVFQGGDVWRMTLGTRDFEGTVHSSGASNDANGHCFMVTNIDLVAGTYTRNYRDLCGGGGGYGDMLNECITDFALDRYLATPEVESVIIDLTAVTC